MGYTHYWTTSDDDAYADAWRPAIIEDTRKIIDAVGERGIVIAGPDGTGDPVISEEEGIAFNGDASEDLDHEPLILSTPGSGSGWEFCKTARKPYDLAVTAVLVRVRMLVPSFSISSDGGEEGFTAARELIAELFGDAG